MMGLSNYYFQYNSSQIVIVDSMSIPGTTASAPCHQCSSNWCEDQLQVDEIYWYLIFNSTDTQWRLKPNSIVPVL